MYSFRSIHIKMYFLRPIHIKNDFVLHASKRFLGIDIFIFGQNMGRREHRVAGIHTTKHITARIHIAVIEGASL